MDEYFTSKHDPKKHKSIEAFFEEKDQQFRVKLGGRISNEEIVWQATVNRLDDVDFVDQVADVRLKR